MSDITMGRYQEKKLRAERDEQRGYSTKYEQVGLAFAIEIILKSAVQSANVQFENAKVAAANTFGTPQDVSHKTTTTAEFSSANIGSAPTKPAKTSKGEFVENGGAEIVQPRSHGETI